MRVKAQSTSGAVRMSPGPNEPRKTYSFSTFVNTNKARVPFAYVMTISEPQADAHVKVYNPKAVEVASATTTGNAAFIFAPPDGGPVQTFDHVQVRPRKGGFKVHFLKDQTFKGMSGIDLISENSARWLLSRAMAYGITRQPVVQAPLTDRFVWMDGRPIGYQLMIEQPNKSFLSRNKRNDSGNLKVLSFEDGLIRQHAKRTTGSHQDLVDLHKNLTRAPATAQWEFIEKHFNVEEFTGYYAVNMCVSELGWVFQQLLVLS